MNSTRTRSGMLATIVACVFGIGGAATVAQASSITYTRNFSFADGSGDETVTLSQFDSMGGTRQLTGVSLSLNLSMDLTATFFNAHTGPQMARFLTDDHIADNAIGAWAEGGDHDTPGPLSFSGALEVWNATWLVLAGQSGTIESSFTSGQSKNFSGSGLSQDVLDQVLGSGVISYRMGSSRNEDGIFTADYSGAVDFVNFGEPIGTFTVEPQWRNLAGTLSITYDFVVIPLPGAVWLGGAGVLAAGVLRRRAPGTVKA